MLPSVSIYPHMGPGSKALKMDLGHLSTDSDTSDHLNCSHSGLRGSLPGGEGGSFFSATSLQRGLGRGRGVVAVSTDEQRL